MKTENPDRNQQKPPHFIDTNIFIYASGSEHPLKKSCQQVLEAISSGMIKATTSTEVLQELMHRYFCIGKRHVGIDIAGMVSRLLQPVLPVTGADIHVALELVSRYPRLSSRDAVHAAVMMNSGITRIVSADRHFESIRDIERLDPVGFI
jgi:hypothetical protein